MTITIPVIAANGAKSTVTMANPNVTSSAARGLITAFNSVSDNWQSPNNVIIDGQPFFCENGNKSWSMTKVDNYTFRSEVRAGDTWGDDGTSRSEILTAGTGIALNSIFNVAWNITVEPGTAGSLAWRSITQVHDGSPFVSLSILGDKMSVLVNQSLSSGSQPYTDPNPIQRGKTYAMKMQMKKSQGSDGFLKIWRDGVQIVNYTGVLGTNTDDATIKFGVYQGWPEDVTTPIAVKYDHLAIDFSAPLPPPPLPSGSNKVGVTTVSSHVDSGNAGLILAQKVVLSTAATLQSLSFFTGNASGNIKMGVYADNNGKPGAKKAETNTAATISGWNTKPVTTPILLQPGTYWMAYEVSSNTLTFRSGNGGSFAGASQAYGTMPATYPTSTVNSDSWSFYMTVNV